MAPISSSSLEGGSSGLIDILETDKPRYQAQRRRMLKVENLQEPCQRKHRMELKVADLQAPCQREHRMGLKVADLQAPCQREHRMELNFADLQAPCQREPHGTKSREYSLLPYPSSPFRPTSNRELGETALRPQRSALGVSLRLILCVLCGPLALPQPMPLETALYQMPRSTKEWRM